MAHLVPITIERRKRVVPFYLDSFWYHIGSTEPFGRPGDTTSGQNTGFLD